jgi:hypothetical protein
MYLKVKLQLNVIEMTNSLVHVVGHFLNAVIRTIKLHFEVSSLAYWYYEKKVDSVIVNNSININKANHPLSLPLIEYRKKPIAYE